MKKFRIMTNGKIFCAEVKTFFGWEPWYPTDHDRFFSRTILGESYASVFDHIRKAYGESAEIMTPFVPAFPEKKVENA